MSKRNARPQLTCYWCGAPATSREHVPPRGFFPEGTLGYQLLTVPSCRAHNEDMHRVDERFRVLIAGGCNTPQAVAHFEGAPKRGLLRPEQPGLLRDLRANASPSIFRGQNTQRIAIVPRDYRDFFGKIARGLCFHHYRKPFRGYMRHFCPTFLMGDPARSGPEIETIFAAFRADEHLFTVGRTTDDLIFSYKYQLVNLEGAFLYHLAATFYNEMTVLTLGRLSGEQ